MITQVIITDHRKRHTIFVTASNSLILVQNEAKNWNMTEILADGYLSESGQQELSNEYQHDRV